MRLSSEFVELLESHAEISIEDGVARKRFTLVFRRRFEEERDIEWLPLTLEPGQRVVACTGGLKMFLGEVWLGLPADRSVLTFETVEQLRLEAGRFRIETFNALSSEESVPLRRRTAVVRINLSSGIHRVFSPTHPVTVDRLDEPTWTMRLDVTGKASMGRFRFFVEPATSVFLSQEDIDEPILKASDVLPEDSAEGREFVEPRRFRPRRRGSLRRLP